MPGKDFAAVAKQYARDIVAKRIPACKWTILGCQRYLDDILDCNSPESLYVFDPEKGNRVCRWVEMMRHARGIWAQRKEFIKLMPWQCFWIFGIFAFLHRDSGLRRCRETLLHIPRKAAKSTTSSAILLYMLCCDGEGAPEVFSGSPKLSQSRECFTPAQRNVKLQPALRKAFGLDARVQSIITDTGGKFIPTCGNPGEGSSPSAFCVDEVWSLTEDSIIENFRLGCASRLQPLGIYTSTSGNNTSGPLYDMCEEAKRILEGTIERPEFFPLMYGIDADTDPFSEEALLMACPGAGVTVSMEKLRSEQKNAKQNARLTNAFLTKYLNVWVGANTAFFNISKYNTLGDPALKPESLKGASCYLGIDLSSKIDLTAVVKVFKQTVNGRAKYSIFPRFYLPQDRINDPAFPHYAQWHRQGFLTATEGSMISYEQVMNDAVADIKQYTISEVALDEWNAGSSIERIQKETKATTITIPQTARMLSDPTKTLDALILEGDAVLAHDANPILAWCLGNVVTHEDTNGNIKPNKGRDPKAKTDGAIALIMALSRALVGGTAAKVTPNIRLL